jgi:putative hydrolases of HD superfamily
MRSRARKQKSDLKGLLNFLAEAGQLKRVKRSGWWVAGVKDPESVADHCFRCAVFGYLLARMEKADTFKVMFMALFNDLHEARLNDLHKIGHRYIDFKAAEKLAYAEQLELLPKDMGAEFTRIRREYDRQESREALLARDADILECVLQAKEYGEFGYKETAEFITVGGKYLRTENAKKLFRQIKKWKYRDWWLHLKKFER